MSQPANKTLSLRKAALVGVVSGTLGGLFGIGGGLIIIPGLTIFVGMERRRAHGTSLASAMIIAIGSLLTYLYHGNVDWVIAVCLAVGSITGAYVGTHLLSIIPKRALIVVFVVTMLATAARLGIGTSSTGRGDLTIGLAAALVLAGFVIGTLAGLLGIGGGSVMVPTMILLAGMTPVIAKGTSVAVIVPTAIMGTIRNRKHDNVDLRIAATVGSIGGLGAIAGATFAQHISDRVSNLTFAVLLLAVAITQIVALFSEDTPALVDDTPALADTD